MKTPREILLARHQAADAKLDEIRRDAIQVAQATSLFRRATSPTEWRRRFERMRTVLWGEGPLPFRSAGCRPGRASCPRYPFFGHAIVFAATVSRALVVPFRELIWPCRQTWAGLAAVWMALLVFNLAQTERGQTAIVRSTISPGELRLALLEQQRVLDELLGPAPTASPTEPPRRVTPQPRSERRGALLMV